MLNQNAAPEFRPLMKLAGPVILAEVGWMSMGLVDTIMVGPLGPADRRDGMGSGVFTAIVIFGMGLMLGLDAFVSQAHGAGDERECLLWLHQGVWLACCVAPIVMALTWIVYSTLDHWGLHPETRRLVGPYCAPSRSARCRFCSTPRFAAISRACTSCGRS